MAEVLAGTHRRPEPRVVRRGLTFGGGIGAIVLFFLSLTPSLLPRHWALQGVVSGISVAIGYGAGTTVGALAQVVWPRLPAASRAAWSVLAAVAMVGGAVFLGFGAAWQDEVRHLVGAEPTSGWDPLLIAVVAAEVFVMLLLVARALRLVTRRIAATFGRFTPQPVASVTAVGLVAALTYGVGPGVAFTGFVDMAERAAAEANGFLDPRLARPESSLVSGGPDSLVAWEDLGAKGRAFVSGAVSTQELVGFTGGEPVPPIRVYVGRDSADTAAQRADLAVRELERTGAFDRAVLAVVTTTGTGWVNPVVADSLEVLHGGDTALVATQYSHLPSWITFMTDRSAATESAAALLAAVRARVDARPPGQRPALVVHGESLGAHGTESALGSLAGMIAATDGALLVGPPHSSPVWRQMTGRQDATTMRRPVPDEAVRFAQHEGDLDGAGAPRVVYLRNASDPIVWWTPELLYRRPVWLDGARGVDVSDAMRWYPAVTFWQVTVDLVNAGSVPSGHGHSYGVAAVDAWAALVPPDGWTAADTARLRSWLEVRHAM